MDNTSPNRIMKVMTLRLTDQIAIVDVFVKRWGPSEADETLEIPVGRKLELVVEIIQMIGAFAAVLLQFQFKTHNWLLR